MEYTDGTNWYSLATENFVINTLTTLKPCMLASTTNLAATYVNGTAGVGATLTSTASATFSIDGVMPSTNDRILIKDQTSAVQNGIYVVTNAGSASTSWVLTRATDYDSPSQMIRGGVVDVALGNTNAVSSWMQRLLWSQWVPVLLSLRSCRKTALTVSWELLIKSWSLLRVMWRP
ncbi:unnamed protein product [Sphagnum jensenii]|uniref:MBG domain-containing protein n=1 Tax=Sphagnum jensenii TaxID=128206 RepID=A0ABP0VIE1_9BRYO